MDKIYTCMTRLSCKEENKNIRNIMNITRDNGEMFYYYEYILKHSMPTHLEFGRNQYFS